MSVASQGDAAGSLWFPWSNCFPIATGSWLLGGVGFSGELLLRAAWNKDGTFALGEGALGVSQAAVSREKYIEITLEYTLAVARAAWAQNPALRFCFLSGCAADREERALSLYGKIKGRTERELAKLNPNLFCFRPAVIKPSRRGEKTPIGATLFTPVTWLVDRLTDGFSVETAVLARCMIDVAKNGAGEAIFDKSRNSQLAEPLNGALVGYA